MVGCVNVYPWRQTDDTRSIEEMVAITAQHDSNAYAQKFTRLPERNDKWGTRFGNEMELTAHDQELFIYLFASRLTPVRSLVVHVGNF